jgi:NitT/TauT family transport system ATP-binding protein
MEGATRHAVSVEGVHRRYGPTHALAGISLRVARGEVYALVGPSGCGKTTLLELIAGVSAPDAGEIVAEPAVLMPQRDLLLPWLSAIDNAALALRLAGTPRTVAREHTGELFGELGLAGFEGAMPHELSGGMRQRVAFLRTLLAGRPVLCLDEPFGALDAITRAEAQRWLADVLTRRPRTVVLVTHDVEEAVLLADRVAVMCARPGRVIAELHVSLARPRSRTEPALVELRERALQALAEGMRAPAGTEEPGDTA